MTILPTPEKSGRTKLRTVGSAARPAAESGSWARNPTAGAMNNLAIEPNDDCLLDEWWGDPPECPECGWYKLDCKCEEDEE